MTEKDNKKTNKVITFLIGNGFDINMGLKTSYFEFANKYIEENPNDKESVRILKKSINPEELLWGDLELKIGEYTGLYSNYNDFYDAYCDIGEKLYEYLSIQDSIYQSLEKEKRLEISKKFVEDLLKLLEIKKDNNISEISIYFITFNYTLMLDEIVDLIINEENIYLILKSKNITINKPYHCHGSILNNKICFGVNDYSQILNQKIFNGHKRYMEQMIKPLRNKYLDNKESELCENIIEMTDIMFCYGCSLGKTDEYWLDNIKEIFLGAQRITLTNDYNVLQFQDNLKGKEKNKLIFYSHKQKPLSFFDADSIEFEDRIKKRISFVEDKRIKIVYDNFFKSLNNIISN